MKKILWMFFITTFLTGLFYVYVYNDKVNNNPPPTICGPDDPIPPPPPPPWK